MHWNFFWQIPASAFILFLVSVYEVFSKLIEPPIHVKAENGLKFFKFNIYQALFLLHFVFGIAYFFRLIFFENYF